MSSSIASVHEGGRETESQKRGAEWVRCSLLTYKREFQTLWEQVVALPYVRVSMLERAC